MKFRGDFQYNEYRLGHFYKSDMKNLAGYMRSYPYALDDGVSDPMDFLRRTVERNDTLYATLKRGSEVLGYGVYCPITNGIGQAHIIKRPMLRLNLSTLRGAGRCLMSFGITVLKLRKIISLVPVVWEPGCMLARLCGLTHEGRLRQLASFNGEWCDMNTYGILSEEF